MPAQVPGQGLEAEACAALTWPGELRDPCQGQSICGVMAAASWGGAGQAHPPEQHMSLGSAFY